jgi:hypothetical protein
LKADCTPAATSFTWTGGGCAGNTTETCSDTPTVATTYTVVARNDKGADTKRELTMTLSGTTPPPSTPTISCTLTASPSAPITPGATVTLTASCSPAATSYVWTGGSCADKTASSCTVTPSATTTYSVTGRNASAPATPRTVTVTVNTPATAAPACTLRSLYGDGKTFTPGEGVLLKADCTPAATSFTWTGGGCAGNTTETCSDTPTVATTYTVVARNDKGPDTKRELTMTPGTASSQCSLTASPASVVVGELYTLIGKCGAASVISAKWSGEGCTEATGSSCTVQPTKAGTFAYTVAFTLQAGVTSVGGVPLTATTTVTVTPPDTPADKPTCTLKANPETPVTPGTLVKLTASCIPFGTYTYTWSNSNSTCLPTSATCDVNPTEGSTYTVTGKNAKDVESNPANVTVIVTPVGSSPLYQGLWVAPNESGWGISLTRHANNIFAAIYTYDANKEPTWSIMSACPIKTDTPSSCKGPIYKMTGGSTPLVTWNNMAKLVSSEGEGEGTFTFTDASHGQFGYKFNIDGVARSKTIEKLPFATGTTPFAVDYTDLWWADGENGWGVALTQDQGMIFAAWYAYDDKGNPVWYTASSCPLVKTTKDECMGTLSRVKGGSQLKDMGLPASHTWPTESVTIEEKGSLKFIFSDKDNGDMNYNIDGNPKSRKITRTKFF